MWLKSSQELVANTSATYDLTLPLNHEETVSLSRIATWICCRGLNYDAQGLEIAKSAVW